ncbi:unnamed protein product [Cladocopium goreaui]|uniref:Uncharacterized protein n=1 Tax=Cladocopium goreaui TaxID=2562237 RepID=A0A9P1FPT9_9DINO|nr:unnamed protein product [Cladocopium goreaui]
MGRFTKAKGPAAASAESSAGGQTPSLTPLSTLARMQPLPLSLVNTVARVTYICGHAVGKYPAFKVVVSGQEAEGEVTQVLVKFNGMPREVPQLDSLVELQGCELRDAWRNATGAIPEGQVIAGLSSRELALNLLQGKRKREAPQCLVHWQIDRSTLRILVGHPDASTFPKATFELLELKHLPADSFGCCGFKICEVGPLGGDGDKVRRQIRVSEISGTAEVSEKSSDVERNLATLTLAAKRLEVNDFAGAVTALEGLTGDCQRRAGSWLRSARQGLLWQQTFEALQAKAHCLNAA